MKKYVVSVYYEYRARVIVEAEDENIDEILSKAYKKAEDVPTECLDYIETRGAEIYDEKCENILYEDF